MKSLAETQVFACLVAFLWLGCTTAQTVSNEDLRQIDVVRLDRNVLKVPSIYSGPEEFRNAATTNGISIATIAVEEFEAALRQSGRVKLSDSAGDEPTIQIAVLVYGFSIPHGFSSQLVPIVQIASQLVDSSGKVIWKTSDRVLPLGNPVEPISPAAMRDNPKLIEDAWRRASSDVARKLVQRLSKI